MSDDTEQTLAGYIHELYNARGRPPARIIVENVPISHATAWNVLSGRSYARWTSVEGVVVGLNGDVQRALTLWNREFEPSSGVNQRITQFTVLVEIRELLREIRDRLSAPGGE